MDLLLDARDIRKRFGGVVALDGAQLGVRPGEVHLLIGENGAGKSTLMKIVAGMLRPDSGSLLFLSRPASFRTPAEAQSAGIAMVHQESLLAPHLSVAENIFLGRKPVHSFGWVNRRQVIAEASRLIAAHNFPLDPEARVERLSAAGRQLVEICRAIAQNARLLIFDEPTSSLSRIESEEVFRIARSFRERGSSVIYITHRMEELRAIGDRVTVLRDGRAVHSGSVPAITTSDLIRHMVGRDVEAIYHRDTVPPGPELFRLENLSRPGAFENISLRIRAGEIVGLAGLIGAGRSELCRAVFGIDPVHRGSIFIDKRPASIRSPRDAVRLGLALIPEDRRRSGLALDRPVAENITLASLPSLCHYGFIDGAGERLSVNTLTVRLNIRAGSPSLPAGRLSGGNQQKVVIARWLAGGARVFLFDEPTRGVDVAAKIEVFRLMDSLAREGAAILMVSSELPELIQVADRILVMRQGRLAAELPGRTTQEEILSHAALETET